MTKHYIDKLAYIYLKDGKILSTRSAGKDTWYIPGGKRETGESDKAALAREVKEELSVDLVPETIHHYGTFEAQAHGKPPGTVVRMTCYTADFSGTLQASTEIEEFDFLTYEQRQQSSPVDALIFDDLYEKGLLLSDNPTAIQKIALAVFKDKKMLMVREAKHKDTFYTLGGTLKEGEAELDCLIREVAEEVSTTIKEGTLRFLNSFVAPAHGRKDTVVRYKLYTGELAAEPVPSSEIEELRYFGSEIAPEQLTPLSQKVFDWLVSEGHVS